MPKCATLDGTKMFECRFLKNGIYVDAADV